MVALSQAFKTNTSAFADTADMLLVNGFTPIPVMPREKAPGEYVAGRWSPMQGWNKYAKCKPDEFTLRLWKTWPNANVGVVLGTLCAGYQLIAVDFDTDDQDELDMLESMLPVSPMRKHGHRGFTAFYRAPADLRTKRYMIDDPTDLQPNRKRCVLELLTGNAPRQTVMPPSIHPNGNAYGWGTDVGIVPLSRLPILTSDHIEQLEDTLQHLGWNPSVAETRPVANSESAGADGDDPFRELNELALENLDAWVPQLSLFGLRKRGAGYEGVPHWRPSNTGQPMEKRKKNLKFHRTGIKDMGDDRGYTAIDVIQEVYGWTLDEAFMWLRQRLGLDKGEKVRILNLPSSLQRNEQGDLYDPDTGEVFDRKVKPQPGEMPNEIEDISVVEGLPAPVRAPTAPPIGADEIPDHLTRPPGLLGDLTDWIEATANTPNRVIAFGAALASLSTIVGRKYASPTRCGTALYVLCLGLSGCGKQHGLDSLQRVLREAKAEWTIGSPEAMSATALVNQLKSQPLSCSPVDEFSQYMKRINSRRAASHEEAIKKVMLSAWGTNYNAFMTPSWAGQRSETIYSPSFSILAMSTPAAFYAALEGSDVENGMLNRFLILKTDVVNRQRGRKLPSQTMPDELKDRLCELFLYDEPACGDPMRQKFDYEFNPILLTWNDEVGDAYADFVDEIHRINNTDNTLAPFYARTAEMGLRIATIQSLSRDPYALKISAEDLKYGLEVAKWSAASMARQARLYMSETAAQSEMNRMLQIIKKAGGKLTHKKLLRSLRNRLRAKDVKDYLGSLRESGAISQKIAQAENGGEPEIWYALKNQD